MFHEFRLSCLSLPLADFSIFWAEFTHCEASSDTFQVSLYLLNLPLLLSHMAFLPCLNIKLCFVSCAENERRSQLQNNTRLSQYWLDFHLLNSPSILTAVHDLVDDVSSLCLCCCVFVSVSPSGCVDLGSVQRWSGTCLADDTRYGTRHTCDPASHDPDTGSSHCPPHHSCTPPLHTHTLTHSISVHWSPCENVWWAHDSIIKLQSVHLIISENTTSLLLLSEQRCYWDGKWPVCSITACLML